MGFLKFIATFVVFVAISFGSLMALEFWLGSKEGGGNAYFINMIFTSFLFALFFSLKGKGARKGHNPIGEVDSSQNYKIK